LSKNNDPEPFTFDTAMSVTEHFLILYEGGIREPFIIRWPGRVPENRIDDESVIGAVDLFPTFCSLSGTEIPEDLDGEDVSTALLGRPFYRKYPLTWEIRFPVYGRVNDMSPRLALRDGEWKFLMNPDQDRVELYNMVEDPGEVDNLARENPELVKKYTEYLLSWYKTFRKDRFIPMPAGRSMPGQRAASPTRMNDLQEAAGYPLLRKGAGVGPFNGSLNHWITGIGECGWMGRRVDGLTGGWVDGWTDADNQLS
jgi:hypothetical protein